MMTKTRFAPSPTGFLHVGGLRTALYAYLVARREGGKFALRIEDTDQGRFVEGAIQDFVTSLRWAGLTIDEGVDIVDEAITQTGDCGPYIQSERLSIYQEHAEKLIAAGHAYYCFCTKERLEELRKFQELNKLAPGYDGHCREADAGESAKRVAFGEAHVVRMKMPKEGTSVFEDAIRGRVEFKNALVDDQVLMKADGFPTYHLAVVVDDHFMQCTHVIRGEEWLSSTPKHLVLYHMFGWEAPTFAHLPLLVNIEKKKLSKRHGDVSVRDYVEKGYLPEALVNFIAFLGWNPGTAQELFTLTELEQTFSLDKVAKSPAVFNLEKLAWYNRQYLAKLPLAEIVARAQPFFATRAEFANVPAEQLAAAIDLERGRVETLAQLPDAIQFVLKPGEYEADMLVWKKGTPEEAKQIFGELIDLLPTLEWTKETLDTKLQAWIVDKGYGVGNVMWPLRVALSGQKNSPGPTELAFVLGQTETLARLKAARTKLN